MRIEISGMAILTDPGNLSATQNQQTGLDLILITHEHEDHLHIDSLKSILVNNPNVKIVTNAAVGKIMDQEGIPYQQLSDGEHADFQGVSIAGMGTAHAEIFEDYGLVENTGFFIDNTLFYPGDAFYNPGIPVKLLALPVAGPWAKVADVLHYALEVKPEQCFPVHDGVLNEAGMAITHNVIKSVLGKSKIEFIPMRSGDEREFSWE